MSDNSSPAGGLSSSDSHQRPDVVAYTRDEFPSRPHLLLRGFTRRCSWCGDRKAYFKGWFRRHERCQSCGHVFRRGDDAFELGAVTANFIMTGGLLLATIAVLIIATAPDIPLLPVTLAAVGVAAIGPMLFYPLSFTVWQAVDLFMRQPTDEELAGTSDGRL